MKFRMVHNNLNVFDLDKSIKFYSDAFDMHEAARRRHAEMGVICCENALPQPSLVIIMTAAYSVSCGLP